MRLFTKLNRISPAVKSSVVYTVASFVSKGIVIITMPIFTRLMATDQMGIVDLYTSWYSMLCVVASLSLTSGGYQVAMKEYPDRRDQYQSSVLSLTTLVALIFSLIFLINPVFWSDLLHMPTSLIGLMLFGFFVYPAKDFWLARQRYEYKYKLSGIVVIGSALLASALSVWMVYKANGRGYANTANVRLLTNYLVTYGVALIIAISIFVKGKTFYNKEFWLFSLSLSIPLIGNSLASQVLSVSDRVMIEQFVGKREVVIYGTVYAISSASQLLWTAINASFVPYLFENIDKNEKKASIKQISNGFMIAYSVFAVVITLMAPEIIKILTTSEYLEAIHIMPAIAAGIFMNSLSNLYSNVLIYHKKTKYVMIATIIGAVTNIVLNYIGIQKFGYMAAAYTTLIAYVVVAVFQCIVSNRVHKKEDRDDTGTVYANGKIFAIAVSTVVLCVLCELVYEYIMVRYGILICISTLIIVFRKKIIALLKETRVKKNERGNSNV